MKTQKEETKVKNAFRNVVLILVLFTLSMVAMPLSARDRDNDREFEGKVAIYKQALKDAVLNSLIDQVAKNPGDQRLVDQMLLRMPLSPLDMFRIRMEANHHEYIVPRQTMDLHQRWLTLHPELNLFRSDVQSTLIASSVGNPMIAIMAATVGTNRNTAATYTPAPTAYDGEIQLAVNKNNTNQMVAGANTWNSTCDTQSVVSSTDGGANWRYSCVPTGSQGSPNFGLSCLSGETWLGSDPAIFWDNSNNVFFNYMLMCCNATCQAGNANPRSSMVVAKSTDSGLTWNAPAAGKGILINHLASGQTAFDDKQFYNIDNNPSSPYYGRHYSCWDTDNNNKFAYSADGGQNWTNVDLPAGPTGVELGCEIAVQKNGTVHEIFNELTCGATCTAEATYYTRSTNGGASWSAPVLIDGHSVYSNFGGSANKIQAANSRGINPFGSIDVDNSGGAYDGRLYVIYSDMASGTDMNLSDTYVRFSTDNGATWSASNEKKVNDDGTSTPQFQGTLVVDQTNGAVVAAWYDGRNDTTNKRKIDIYSSRSTDGGATWEANTKVTQNSSEFTNNTGISYSDENSTDNSGANPNNYGEYLGVDAHSGKGFFAWTDSRPYFPSGTTNAQKENIGFAAVTFTAATPDFGVSASPASVTINQGASGTSTITVSSTNSFNSAVSLSASGLPSGVTASFSPTSVTPPANGSGTSTLTLTASASATTGTVTVTVTGTSGATTHTTTISLTVNVVDTTAPTTSLTAPTAGSTLSGNATVSANASDNIGVTKVEFYAGAALIGTDTTSPYSITWNTNTVTNGPYTLTSKAFDAANNTATSAGVSVTVNNTTPTGITNGTFETGNLTGWTSVGTTGVATTYARSGSYGDRNGSTVATNGDSNIVQTFTVPTGGGTVSFWYKMTCPDSITYDWVTATLKNNSTSVTTTLLAKTCATNASWVQVTSGALTAGTSYTLTLTSHDDNYASDPSYTYFDDVVFTGVDTTAPTTSLTAPAAGTVTGTITVSANASDNVGVTKVEFYAGATLIGTDTTSPYSISWNTTTVANGNYTLTSKAYDAANNTGTSAGVVVTVSNTAPPPDNTATYNTTYKAPACPAGGKSCDTGATLVNGRGTMTSGNELNRPNTLNATCADGNLGTYHSDESLDRVKIATNDGTALAAGKAVTVTFTAYCYSSTDKLDVYYTTNVTTPSWVLVGTQSCTAAGVKAFTATYTLPSGSTTQAVRGNLRYSSTAGSCTTGSYDDRDDLVFGVN